MERSMIRLSLRVARANAMLTQREAATLLKISEQTLSNYERGISYPTAPMIADMVKVYGLSCMDDIKWYIDYKPQKNKEGN